MGTGALETTGAAANFEGEQFDSWVENELTAAPQQPFQIHTALHWTATALMITSEYEYV